MLRYWAFASIILTSLVISRQQAYAQDWQSLTTPTGSGNYVTPYFLNSNVGFTFVAGIYENRGYPAVSGGTTMLARTTNGGINWQSINFFDSIECAVSQLCFVSLTHGFASTVSLFEGSSAPSGIYETFDQGTHWKKITPGNQWFESVYAAGGSIFAVKLAGGFNSALGSQLIYSGNDGVSWDSVPRPGSQLYSQPPYYGGFQWIYGNRDSLLASIYLYPDANVYLVYSSDLGKHWQTALLDRNYQWPMQALFLAPHSCRIFREYLDNKDMNGDTYSVLQADPPYTNWNFSITHLESGAWIIGNSCASYLSYAGQEFHGPLVRTTDGGASWPFVGTTHTDGREPNINEIDDHDWQNLSVVGYGATVYAMGTDFSGYLWKTTDGGDGALSESVLAPKIALDRSPFFSGNDTLVTNLCSAWQVAISIQNLSCAITRLNSVAITGLSPTEFTDSFVTHHDCSSLPDTIFLTIAPTSSGIRPVAVNMKFIDDEYHEIDTLLTFTLQIRPGTTVPLSLSLGSGAVSPAAGDTISVPVYLSGDATLGATAISLPFAIDTNALVPVGFQPAIIGMTADAPFFRDGRLDIELRSPGLSLSSDTLLGVLRCVAYFGDSLRTSISLASAGVSATMVPCLALSLQSASTEVNIVGCGLPLLQQLMRTGNVSLTIRTIAPNPAADFVRIEFDNPGSSSIAYEILDALGTVRAEGAASGSVVLLDTHSLSAGLYYVQARTADGARAVSNFVVEK